MTGDTGESTGRRALSTIVVPLVDSPAGTAALEFAKREVLESGGLLIVVGTANVGDHVAGNVEAVRWRLSELEKEMADEGVRCRTEWFVGQSLGDATVHTADHNDADLIVTSLRRRTPVGKALMGSFEQQILLSAQCPVLCFPAT